MVEIWFFLLLPLLLLCTCDRVDDFSHIPMPSHSYFNGFDPPNDLSKWKMAQVQAQAGEHVLYQRVMEHIHSWQDIFTMDVHYRWLHHLSDIRLGYEEWTKKPYRNIWKDVSSNSNVTAADLVHRKEQTPIVMFGNWKFERDDYTGKVMGLDSFNPDQVRTALGKGFRIDQPIVALGLANENWGWASTYFLNRSIHWSLSLDRSNEEPLDESRFRYSNEVMREFLDNENVLMLVVNQHHNISHSKVLSLPLGLLGSGAAKQLFRTMVEVPSSNIRRSIPLSCISSDFAFRPALRQCVMDNIYKNDMYFKAKDSEKSSKNHSRNKGFFFTGLGDIDMSRINQSGTDGMGGNATMDYGNLNRKIAAILNNDGKNHFKQWIGRKSIPKDAFRKLIVGSYAVLCIPGLGYDTYRLWESLYLGAMPIVERGAGMDRTFHKLPVLLVDDYIELSTLGVRQAYLQALYIANDHGWEYERLTKQYWIDLIRNVSHSRSASVLQQKHPIVDNINFVRPLIPFVCEQYITSMQRSILNSMDEMERQKHPQVVKCKGSRKKGETVTNRTPPRSCALDADKVKIGYKWRWMR